MRVLTQALNFTLSRLMLVETDPDVKCETMTEVNHVWSGIEICGAACRASGNWVIAITIPNPLQLYRENFADQQKCGPLCPRCAGEVYLVCTPDGPVAHRCEHTECGWSKGLFENSLWDM